MEAPQNVQVEGLDQEDSDAIPFQIPGLIGQSNGQTNSPHEAVLLLAWLLVLYRYSDGNPVECTWGFQSLERDGKSAEFKAALSAKPTDSIASALTELESILSQDFQIKSYTKLDGSKFFFQDKSVAVNDTNQPNGTAETHSPEQSWSVQLEAEVRHDVLWLRPSCRDPTITRYMATRYTHAMAEILSTIYNNSVLEVRTILDIGPSDLEELWRWNGQLPPLIDICMHDLIAIQAKIKPKAQAIDSWDGKLTYEEVEYWSTHLAHQLASLGVGIGQTVPLCFEKSRWTVIAVLAVMKAGGTFVLMDPSQPLGRLHIIAQEVQAKFIITSKSNWKLGCSIVPDGQVVSLGDGVFPDLSSKDLIRNPLPPVPTDTILYLVFTSGSTGKPKGVIISHETYTSSAFPRSEYVGYKSNSRVLDFASYAFDVSIDSMLCTLLRGGCLCIPSDEARMNDLSDAMRRLKVTMSNMTPSVARILDLDIIPSLSSLGLGGESCSASDVALWGQHTRVVIGYGPSECTIGCTINSSAANGRPWVNMGSGNGGLIWVVDPEDHNRLMPIGAVGELLVEGPIVGQGYLNEPEKTATAFIEDPIWLLNGHGDVPGRNGRLYKTGDLVTYDPDGNSGLVFVGRKDSQVKLRGQRVELGEIEHHLRSNLPSKLRSSVEVLKPQGKKESVLVAFIAEPNPSGTQPATDSNIQQVTFSPEVEPIVASLDDILSKVLPVYMIPSAYIPINRMPMLVTGKIDRKLLRSAGASMFLQRVTGSRASEAEKKLPSSSEEKSLQEVWSRLLGIQREQIGSTDNFFNLGGDSILAMRLVAATREQGYTLTVADIFSNPKLAAMAKRLQKTDPDMIGDVPAFSLLDPKIDRENSRITAAQLCGIDPTSIEDIYPCTPLQEILLAFSERTAQQHVTQRVAEIQDASIIPQFKAAWETASTESPILRTRIVELPEVGFFQVVLKEKIIWKSANKLEDYLQEDKTTPMTLGTLLSRYAILTETSSGKNYFVWTIHHALYDGWSTPLILERVKRAYHGLTTTRPAQMKNFIKFLFDPIRQVSKTFWRVQLQGATCPQFPALPSRSYLPQPDSMEERFIPLQRDSTSAITVATIIRGAWAMVASKYTSADDVVFGETLIGRSLPIPGVEQIEGPMITTVPVRIRIDKRASLQEYLQTIQDQGLARIPHEHLGMQNIRRVSPDAQLACEVRTGLVIQPDDLTETDELSQGFPMFQATDPAREALQFNSYPLLLACSLKPDGFLVMASFDSNLVSALQMQRVLTQLDCAIQQLSKEDLRQVSEIDLSELDRNEIWSWNKIPPASIDENTGSLLSPGSRNISVGEKYPSLTVPWIIDPSNTQHLMPIGTVGELVFEGPLTSTNCIEDPSWLLKGSKDTPGRHGNVHRTGDLAKYSAEGSIIFMGRKDTRVEAYGQVIDLNEVEHHLRSLLPSSTQAVVQVISPSNDMNNPLLVAFVSEKSASENQLAELTLNGSLKRDQSGLSNIISTTISTELADSLIDLNKSLSDVLPPHLIPSAYIPLRELPLVAGDLDRERLRELSQVITFDLVSEIKVAFSILKEARVNNQPLTKKEQQLQKLWANILGIEAKSIDLDDSFFRLGGDSIMAMKLVSAARQVGFKLSVTDIFQHMRFRDMVAVLTNPTFEAQTKTYLPFSALEVENVETFLTKEIRPALTDQNWKIKDVLPCTDTQELDIKATIEAPRSAVQYNLLYLDKSINVERLAECCTKLISQHEILRTIFVGHQENYLQVILEEMDCPLTQHEASDDLDDYSNTLCATDIENPMDLGSSFLKFMFVLGKGDQNCFIIRLSHAQYDGISLPEVIRQFGILYEGQSIPKTPDFSTFIHHLQEIKTDGLHHWKNQLQDSTITVLQPTTPEEKIAPAVFIKKSINTASRPSDITMATMLTTGWAIVLARFLSIKDVTFGGIVSGRNVSLSDVESIIGPCYNYVPIRVRFSSNQTARDLLHAVKQQEIQNMGHDWVGFKTLARNCTSWPEEVKFFDSIVHQQDVEYFDHIPFAGTQCRVEIANPHAEPASPMRVVSYIEDGKIYVGISAGEAQQEFVKARLDELCEIVAGFIEQPDAIVAI